MPHYHDESEQSCSHDHDGRAEAISCEQGGCNDQDLIYKLLFTLKGYLTMTSQLRACLMCGKLKMVWWKVVSYGLWSEVLKLSKNLSRNNWTTPLKPLIVSI